MRAATGNRAARYAPLLGMIALAATFAADASATQPVFDGEAVAKTIDLINETKKLAGNVVEVRDAIDEQIAATGLPTVLRLPSLDIGKIRTRLSRDLNCLLPDVKNLLPRIKFENVDYGSICNIRENYQKALSFNPHGDAAQGMSSRQRAKRRALIRSRRDETLDEAALGSLAAGTVGLESAKDMDAAADALGAAGTAATNINERLAVMNQGIVLMVRAQSQTNALLAQTLRLIAAAEVVGLRTDIKPISTGAAAEGERK